MLGHLELALGNPKRAWELLSGVNGPAATTEMAGDTFEVAASRYGLPRQVLSDTGLAFTERLRSFEVTFETNLKDLGVEPINSAPYQPQTLGKLERLHRTLKEWLSDEGPAWDLEHLQELLDGFRFTTSGIHSSPSGGGLGPANRRSVVRGRIRRDR